VDLNDRRAGGVRSDQHTARNIPYEEWETQGAGEQSAEQTGDNNEDEISCNSHALTRLSGMSFGIRPCVEIVSGSSRERSQITLQGRAGIHA